MVGKIAENKRLSRKKTNPLLLFSRRRIVDFSNARQVLLRIEVGKAEIMRRKAPLDHADPSARQKVRVS